MGGGPNGGIELAAGIQMGDISGMEERLGEKDFISWRP